MASSRARAFEAAALVAAALLLAPTVALASGADVPLDAAPPPAPIGVSATLANSVIFRSDPREATWLMTLGAGYDLSSWLSAFARVGWAHDTRASEPSGSAFANPSAGVNVRAPVGKHLTLGGTLGGTLPFGSGGGNAPSAEAFRAWSSSIDWGGAMYAVDHVDGFAGVKAAYATGPVTLTLESTLHELVRVRGEAVDPIGAAATVTSTTATTAFAVTQAIALSAALSETRFWNTPAAVQASPASRTDMFAIGGVSWTVPVGRTSVSPTLLYARALDEPLSAMKYQVVELDLGFSM